MKYILIFFGLLFLFIGFVGIVVPGLPTTPFMLLSAWFFVRSSKRLYNWVISNKYFGKHVKNYRERKAIPLTAKIISLISMWLMISVTAIFVFESLSLRLLILALGIIGSVVILIIPTYKE